MNSIWDRIFWGNSLRDWGIACCIAMGSIILLRVLQAIVLTRLKKMADRTKTTLDDFIVRQVQVSLMPFLYLLAIYTGFQYLSLSPKADNVGHVAMLIISIFFGLKIINGGISYAFSPMIRAKREGVHHGASRGIIIILRVVTGLIALLFVIDNLGYNITTLITGLGIGGVAIALASQTVLGDLFNYLAIYFDKPFEPGDFIVLDDTMGTVQYIGLRTTRLLSLGGEQLVCSNTDLTSARVHNYKRMQERRSIFTIGVVYSTSASTLKKIPIWVKDIIGAIPQTRFDRAHFRSFGASSLDFEIVYFILSPDYNKYMDIQQQLNLALVEKFETEHVEFAFPTQTVYVTSENNDNGSANGRKTLADTARQ